MSHSNDRFNRTVKRIGAESYWLYTYHKAICGLGVDAIGLDFFRVALNSLKDARLIRLIRILEDDSQCASFWYLHKSNTKLVNQIAKDTSLDLNLIRSVSDRFLGIRNKTFVHIDKDVVFDPQKMYRDAGITHDEVEHVIESLWRFMRALHLKVFDREIMGDEYTGEDIKYLADLRDKDIAVKAQQWRSEFESS